MMINLNLKEKMQEADIELMNCVLIVASAHVETCVLLREKTM